MAGQSLHILSSPVQFLSGIGPRRAEALKECGVETLFDLLLYVPRRYLDRSSIVTIARLRSLAGASAAFDEERAGQSDRDDIRKDYTIIGDVRSFRVLGAGHRSRFVLVLGDQTGTLQCIWFGGVQYWKNIFRIGEVLAVSGQPSMFSGVMQIVHPDIDRITAENDESVPGSAGVDWSGRLNTGGLVPLYPSGQALQKVGLDSAGFRRVLHRTIETHHGKIQEFLPDSIMRGRGLMELAPAIHSVHFPGNQAALSEGLRRLKYQELFLFQLRLVRQRRERLNEAGGIVFNPKSSLARKLVDGLPFSLTRAQIRVINQISNDVASGKPMNRLLQGDVGSGKTVVALIAMLLAIDNGYQATLLAPTEVLAEQHARTLTALLKDLPISIRVLIGAQRSRHRREVLEGIRTGEAQIILGTHALLEPGVTFANLGLAIVDEQHRFGVMQRARLRGKGTNPHLLVMTATPIPRTLSMTLYGDLDVSVIDELPRGRKPIRTMLKDERHVASIHAFVREQVGLGRQAYFVYPLVEESETVDLKAATSHFEHLQQSIFPELKVGLMHGRMSSDEKDGVMLSFKRGELRVLVATTVIEVGIDVPNASVMVIEDAERFGLSQLHQLRGRVGRGAEQSYCILMTKQWIAAKARRGAAASTLSLDEHHMAQRRLAAMVETNDGFKIAEMDLALRGPGDYFGTRQSGVPAFRVADLLTDGVLLEQSRADAFVLIDHDPELEAPEHRMLHDLLRIVHAQSSSLFDAG